jgi:hypothetical protein
MVFKSAYTSIVSGPGFDPPSPSNVQDFNDFQTLLSPYNLAPSFIEIQMLHLIDW